MTFATTTPRLRITALTPLDAPALFAYRGDPQVLRFQGFAPQRVEDAEAFIASTLHHSLEEPGQWCQLAVRLEQTDELIGDLGVKRLAHEPRQAEIGFTIAPAHQRRGFALEATSALLEHLFCEREVHRVVASVDPDNAASRALLSRLGMRQEAHFRKSYWFKGGWVDDVVCAILREEWRTAHAT